jgi:hypothetical protein
VILYGCETWVSKIKEGTQTEGVWENNICAEEGLAGRKFEKTA